MGVPDIFAACFSAPDSIKPRWFEWFDVDAVMGG